jgi:hypothetical protein
MNIPAPEIGSTQRKRMVQWTFGIWILAWCYRLHAHVLLHQMEAPVLNYPYIDLTYWLAHFARIPELSTQNHILAYAIDLALLLIPILCLLLPEKRRYPILFTLFFLPYYFSFNTFGMSHTHCLIGFLFVPMIFWSNNVRTQYFLWEAVRYFTLWIFVCAFFWKLGRGYFFEPEHGQAILQSTRAAYLFYQGDTWLGQLLKYLISHPELSYALMVFGALLQGSFIIGFFTKKLDTYYFWAAVVFHLTTWILMDIVFFELLVCNISFAWWLKPEK